MYNIEDKPMAVREIQKYLLVISQKEDEPVAIVVDGVYGENTKIAVIAFQEKSGLPPTGAVDILTFYALEKQYSDIMELNEASRAVIDDAAYPLGIADSSDDVAVLNGYLRALSRSYPDMPLADKGNFYSKNTEDAVKHLQSKMMLEESGTVDHAMFVRIKREINFRNMIDKSSSSV
jgi:peptidoglycan hydrolase-like protein with peptidoglycan-binding domain